MNNILKGILSLVVVVLLLESAARIAATVHDQYQLSTSDEKWYVMSADRGWGLRPGFHGRARCGVSGDFDDHGFLKADSAQITARGKPKILFLGDSTTFGYCVDSTATFAEVTEKLVPGAISVNLGVPGYTSFQGYKTLLKYGELVRPDIIVISFNYNDRRYVLSHSESDSDRRFAEITRATRLANLVSILKTSYVVRSLDKVIRLTGIAGHGWKESHSIRLDKVFARVNPESYRRNLENMARWAGNHHSRVIFLLLGDNPVQTEYLQKGIHSMELARDNDAIDQFKVAVHNRHFGPLARIFLAQIYEKERRPGLAESIISVPPYQSLHGGHAIFTDSVYNDIMRDVGKRHGITVVDARAVLNGQPWHYVDHCHLDAGGHREVAELLRDRIVALMGSRNQTRKPGVTAYTSHPATYQNPVPPN